MGWLKRLDGAKRGACTILRGRKHFEPERGEIITDFVTYFSRIITLTGLSSHRALRATTREKKEGTPPQRAAGPRTPLPLPTQTTPRDARTRTPASPLVSIATPRKIVVTGMGGNPTLRRSAARSGGREKATSRDAANARNELAQSAAVDRVAPRNVAAAPQVKRTERRAGSTSGAGGGAKAGFPIANCEQDRARGGGIRRSFGASVFFEATAARRSVG